MKTLISAAFALLLFAVHGSALAQRPPSNAPAAQQANAKLDIEQMRQTMANIEAQLQREQLADSELERLKERLRPIFEGVQAILERETPRLDEINARLEKIGPAPKDKDHPESADVARSRAEQEGIKKEIDEAIRVAKLMQVRAEQAHTAIADYRRRLFTQEILSRSESIASPWLWAEVLQSLPDAVSGFHALIQFRLRQALYNVETGELIAALGLLIIMIGSYIPARRMLLGRLDSWAKDPTESPTRRAKAMGAIRGMLLRTILPLMVAIVLLTVVRILGIGADRLGEFLKALFFSFPIVAFLRGLLVGIVQPQRPLWRVAQIEQRTASLIFPALWSMILVVFVGKIIEAASQFISASLPITVAAKGMTAVASALVLIMTLRKLDSNTAVADASLETMTEDDASEAHAGHTMAIMLKVVGWFICIAIVASAVLGYISLSAFLNDQVVWLLALGGLLALLLILTDEFLIKGTNADSALSRRLRASTGISPNSIQQIGILGSGIVRFLLLAAGAMLALAPYGVNSGDILGSFRAALFGFQIGGVTVSISSILLAIGVFVGLVLMFRSIQGWVKHTYLPATSLDSGLQNSITTVIGYIGFVLSAILALSYIGLSMDRIAIIAGALSVGIGFGLQSIVGNFVSGLILLWERPIKVGDLIVIGPDTGRVRNINVRSTEIETADRPSLIVPNAEFITGRVKNMMHANRIARIVIPISVAPDADPHLVRDVLLRAANAHQEVMSSPAASVLFLDVTAGALNFELRCFVDIDAQISVRSDLMFEIYRLMREKALIVPPPREVTALEGIQDMVETIANRTAGPAPNAKT